MNLKKGAFKRTFFICMIIDVELYHISVRYDTKM